MAGRSTADLLVRRISEFAAGVAGFDRLNADQRIKNTLQAPKAATGQCRDFFLLVFILRIDTAIIPLVVIG